ncbi:MAG: hypothetical protein WCA20_06540 [Candidatus Sulfotelmatobacter sp.]
MVETEPLSAAEVQRGGTLTLARPDEPLSLDPFMPSDNGSIYAIAQVCEPLVLAGLLMPCASAAQTFELDSTKGLQPHDVTVEAVSYHGRKAARVMPAAAADAELLAPKNGEGGGIVVLSGTSFHNGTIEVDVAGKPRAGAASDARGFVGVAFR